MNVDFKKLIEHNPLHYGPTWQAAKHNGACQYDVRTGYGVTIGCLRYETYYIGQTPMRKLPKMGKHWKLIPVEGLELWSALNYGWPTKVDACVAIELALLDPTTADRGFLDQISIRKFLDYLFWMRGKACVERLTEIVAMPESELGNIHVPQPDAPSVAYGASLRDMDSHKLITVGHWSHNTPEQYDEDIERLVRVTDEGHRLLAMAKERAQESENQHG